MKKARSMTRQKGKDDAMKGMEAVHFNRFAKQRERITARKDTSWDGNLAVWNFLRNFAAEKDENL